MRMQSKWMVVCLTLAIAGAWVAGCGREDNKPGAQGKTSGVTLVKSEGGAPTGGAASAPAPGTKNIDAQPSPAAPMQGVPAGAPPAGAMPVAPGAGMPAMAGAGGPAIEAIPVDAKSITLRYSVLLENDTTLRMYAPENMTFASGQGFRLMLLPSQDFFLYMIHEGTDGRFALLAPLPGQGTSLDRLPGGETAVLPLTGVYRMDRTPGTERIHVVAAPHKVERIEQLIEGGVFANDPGRISRTLDAVRQRQEVGYEVNKKIGSKYSELKLTGDDSGRSYIVGVINLKHQ